MSRTGPDTQVAMPPLQDSKVSLYGILQLGSLTLALA
jgi:hypothetical protein